MMGDIEIYMQTSGERYYYDSKVEVYMDIVHNHDFQIDVNDEDMKCKNYDFCKRFKRLTYLDNSLIPIPASSRLGNDYVCDLCRKLEWNLEFRDSEEDCAICMRNDIKQVKFPTNCGHWFCVTCSKHSFLLYFTVLVLLCL